MPIPTGLIKSPLMQVLLVQYKHNLLEDADSAMVVLMSELVQLQDMELALLINAVPNMVPYFRAL